MKMRAHFLTRGASPLALPHTLSRAPLRRRAPFAWLTRCRSFAEAGQPRPVCEIRSSVRTACVVPDGKIEILPRSANCNPDFDEGLWGTLRRHAEAEPGAFAHAGRNPQPHLMGG